VKLCYAKELILSWSQNDPLARGKG